MKLLENQTAVFNRTDRIEIPGQFIRPTETKAAEIIFKGLISGDWNSHIEEEQLMNAVLYVDVASILSDTRETITDCMDVFADDWEGRAVRLAPELVSGDHRVRMQVTIALPDSHKDAGRILAKSAERVIISGPDGDGTGDRSLLDVRKSEDLSDLYKLDIDSTQGPTLLVTATIPQKSWRELAEDPLFQYTVLPGIVRDVLHYLVYHPESRDTWGAPWLEYPGIKGHSIPDIEELIGVGDVIELFNAVDDYVSGATERFIDQQMLGQKLAGHYQNSKKGN